MGDEKAKLVEEVLHCRGHLKALEGRDEAWNLKWSKLEDAYMLTWHSHFSEALQVLGNDWKRDIWSGVVSVLITFWDFNFGESKQSSKSLDMHLDHLEDMSNTQYNKTKPGYFGSSQTEQEMKQYLDSLVGIAFANLLRAIARFRGGSYVKGGYYLRRSWVTLKEAEGGLHAAEKAKFGIEPEVKGNIMFGLGFFNFAISLIPPSLQFLVKLLGFEGDREAAMAELEFAKNAKTICRIEASIALYALKKYFTDQEEEAELLMEEILGDYPDSPTVLYLAALILRMKSQTTKSIPLLHHAIEKSSHEQMKITLNYHLATTYVMVGEYENAIKHHTFFTENSTGIQFQVWSHFQLACSQWILHQDPIICSPLFQYVVDHANKDQPLEKMALRKSKEFFSKQNKSSISPFPSALLIMSHIHEGQLFDRLLKDEYPKCKELAETPEEKAVCYYYKASALKGTKQTSKAFKYYNRVTHAESEIKNENYTYIVPYSWTELAEMDLQDGKYSEAKTLLKRAKKYSDYDWANLLSIRINANMDKLIRREKVAEEVNGEVGTESGRSTSTVETSSSSIVTTPNPYGMIHSSSVSRDQIPETSKPSKTKEHQKQTLSEDIHPATFPDPVSTSRSINDESASFNSSYEASEGHSRATGETTEEDDDSLFQSANGDEDDDKDEDHLENNHGETKLSTPNGESKQFTEGTSGGKTKSKKRSSHRSKGASPVELTEENQELSTEFSKKPKKKKHKHKHKHGKSRTEDGKSKYKSSSSKHGIDSVSLLNREKSGKCEQE